MSSPSDSFLGLPTELFFEVIKRLHHHDLAQLMRVSHQFNKVIEPILWTKIELHRFSFHEDYALKDLRQEEAALQRPYQRPYLDFIDDDDFTNEDAENTVDALNESQYIKVALFLALFSEKTMVDRKRAEHLAGLVRWLCLPANGQDGRNIDDGKTDPWNALAIFPNLEYLEISAYWKSSADVVEFKGGKAPMSNLKTLKLRGYVDADFVKYVCSSASTINLLQLAALDAPIPSFPREQRQNRPPPADPTDEETEDLDWEAVGPRALACLTPEIISQFRSLTHLYLTRPCQGITVQDPNEEYQPYCSVKSEERILKEWINLIRASRKTLTHLTLDQRPIGHETESDVTSPAFFMEVYCNGPGYQRFVKIAAPALLEEAEWPALKSIRLFGFEMYPHEHDESVNLEEKLQGRFGSEVEILSAMGRRTIMLDKSGEIQEGGDVIDCSDGFDEEDDDDPTYFWQCRPGQVKADWSFGFQSRTA